MVAEGAQEERLPERCSVVRRGLQYLTLAAARMYLLGQTALIQLLVVMVQPAGRRGLVLTEIQGIMAQRLQQYPVLVDQQVQEGAVVEVVAVATTAQAVLAVPVAVVG